MAKKKTLKDAFAALTSRWTENRQAMRSHLREFVVDAARAKLANEPFELEDNETDVLLSLLDGEGMTPDDFEANVAAHVQRIHDADLAGKRPALESAASRLSEEVKQFESDLWKRHNENLKTLNAMDCAAVEARTRLYAAVQAESNIQAAGEISQEERELGERKRMVSERIDELKAMLSTSRPFWQLGNYVASATTQPALAILEAEREVAEITKSARPTANRSVERLKELKAIIAKAREVIPTIEDEIAKLAKEGDKIDAQLHELAVARPFVIIKPRRAHAVA